MMEVCVCVCVCAHGTMFASGGSRAIDITISLFDPGAVKVGKDLHGFGLIHSVTTLLNALRQRS